MIQIVLIDDHELVRTGFRMILQQQPDMSICGEAASAEEGLRLIRSLKPEIALVDVHMPGMSGIELTERVSRAELATRIVVVTVVDDGRFPKRLLDAGASGYLTKGCSADELVTAVRQTKWRIFAGSLTQWNEQDLVTFAVLLERFAGWAIDEAEMRRAADAVKQAMDEAELSLPQAK